MNFICFFLNVFYIKIKYIQEISIYFEKNNTFLAYGRGNVYPATQNPIMQSQYCSFSLIKIRYCLDKQIKIC